jgi:hypothetical protein
MDQGFGIGCFGEGLPELLLSGFQGLDFLVEGQGVGTISDGHDQAVDLVRDVRRLFAAATALIETAHKAAIAGQSEVLTAWAYAEAAHRLQGTARDIAALAEAAAVIAGLSDGDPPSRPDQTP